MASTAVGVAVVACMRVASVAAPPLAAAPAADEEGLSPDESAIIARTNAVRGQRGLPPLAIDQQLMQSARNHARWMAANRSLSHGTGVTENIAMGQTSAAEAVSGWMNSSGHRRNILDPGHAGIGAAVARGSDGSLYWCQQFR